MLFTSQPTQQWLLGSYGRSSQSAGSDPASVPCTVPSNQLGWLHLKCGQNTCSASPSSLAATSMFLPLSVTTVIPCCCLSRCHSAIASFSIPAMIAPVSDAKKRLRLKHKASQFPLGSDHMSSYGNITLRGSICPTVICDRHTISTKELLHTTALTPVHLELLMLFQVRLIF